jgi:hypothetical protein
MNIFARKPSKGGTLKHTSTPKALSKVPEIADHAGYAVARTQLDRIKAQLAQILSKSERNVIRRNRMSETARNHLSRMRVLPAQTDIVFDEICTKVIAAGEIAPALMARLRYQTPKIKLSDSNDAELLDELQEVEAAKEILKRAVVLAEKEVSRQKRIAIAEISSNAALRSERDKIAWAIASALAALVMALKEERELVVALRRQDESLPNLLSPRPFPFETLADPRLDEWLALSGRDQAIDARALLVSERPREISKQASQ